MTRRFTPKRSFFRFNQWFSFLLRWSSRLLVLAGIGFFGFWVYNQGRTHLRGDTYFKIKKVSILPGNLLTQGEYRFLEEKLRGKSILELDLRNLSQTLEQNPKIKEAEVVRSFPDQLKIYLTARQPYTQVQLSPRGFFYEVSDDGLVISVERAPKPDLPIVQDFFSREKEYKPGMRYQNESFPNWKDFFRLLDENEALQNEEISKNAVDHLGNFTAFLRDGIEIRLSKEAVISSNSTSLLKTLLQSGERPNLMYVDLRYGDVVVKKKSDR